MSAEPPNNPAVSHSTVKKHQINVKAPKPAPRPSVAAAAARSARPLLLRNIELLLNCALQQRLME
jgi:hypothetical protein